MLAFLIFILTVFIRYYFRENSLWYLREFLSTNRKGGSCGREWSVDEKGQVQYDVSKGELEEKHGKEHRFCLF